MKQDLKKSKPRLTVAVVAPTSAEDGDKNLEIITIYLQNLLVITDILY